LLKSLEEGTIEARCDIHSHTTFTNLTTPQKAQRYRNVCDSYQQSYIIWKSNYRQVDGVNVEATHMGLLSILENYQEESKDSDTFESIFW